MAQKKKKSKISSIKRGNQLRTKLLKQGKLKLKRHKNKKKIFKPSSTETYNENINSDNEENALDMIENEDISFLQEAVASKKYSFLNDINVGNTKKKSGLKRKFESDNEVEEFERQYENEIQDSKGSKKKKYLLPIKTSKGLIVRSEEVNSSEDEKENLDLEKEALSMQKSSAADQEFIQKNEISSADLMAFRENSLLKTKFRIGVLCSGLTENPEVKIHNFKPLLNMLSENDPDTSITAKKLTFASLFEVFKDLVPEYQIKHHNEPKVKLKKVVKQLRSYENDLVRYYKEYLKKLEKIISILKNKKGDTRTFQEAEIKLAELGLQCLCDLLIAHPYFNFSKNIVHLLVPFLNHSKQSVRNIVSKAIKTIFKQDKRGEISLEIVKKINKYVKSRSSVSHTEVLSVFLSLNLKDINLEKEKEEEIKKKNEENKINKFVKLSKREKKRKKKFQNLEKELLETKAEENKKAKEACLTEITKTLFAIYFRILKETPSSKLLNAALEGLAKFAHCINVEFYHDLVLVLDQIISNEKLGYKERLCCVQTVFTVLHYQGATISIDPIRFYSHFYSNILCVNAGKNHDDLSVILKTTDMVLLKRRKHLSLQRLLAFIKRLNTLALQVLPNGSLALLNVVKQILQVNNSTDILLDFDSAQGQGIYYPEMEEPEYCNAGATALWELFPLQKHYHPTVREFAKHVASTGSQAAETPQLKNFLKQSPEQLFEEFDPTNVKFNPAIPAPTKFPKSKNQGFLNAEFENYMKTVLV